MKNQNTITIIVKRSSDNFWYKNLIGQQLNAIKTYDGFLVDVEDNNIYMDEIPVRGFISGIVEFKDADIKQKAQLPEVFEAIFKGHGMGTF